MTVDTELERIKDRQANGADPARARQALAAYAHRSGVGAGPAREWYVKLLMHRLGLNNGRGDKFQYPAPPAKLKGHETAFVERCVKRDLDELIDLLIPKAPSASSAPAIPPERPDAAHRDRGRSWGEA